MHRENILSLFYNFLWKKYNKYDKLYDKSLADYYRNLLKIECDDTYNFKSKRLNNSSKFV